MPKMLTFCVDLRFGHAIMLAKTFQCCISIASHSLFCPCWFSGGLSEPGLAFDFTATILTENVVFVEKRPLAFDFERAQIICYSLLPESKILRTDSEE